MDKISVYPIGTKVGIDTGDEAILATIVGIKLFSSGYSYIVSYWKEKIQYTITVDEFELAAKNTKKKTIGFTKKEG